MMHFPAPAWPAKKLRQRLGIAILPLTLALAACGGVDSGPSAMPAAQAPSAAASPGPDAVTQATAADRGPAAANPADRTCGLVNFRQELLERVNRERASGRMCGDGYYAPVAPLAWNDTLAAAGYGHALDMATSDYFSHTSQDGRTFDQRIANAGYAWLEAGENIAAGQQSVARVMADWLASPGHCVNIMNPLYTEIGVACVDSSAATYSRYWAMEFGLPK